MRKRECVKKVVRFSLVLGIGVCLAILGALDSVRAQPQYGGVLKIITPPRQVRALGYPLDLRLPYETFTVLPAVEMLLAKNSQNLPIPGSLSTDLKFSPDWKTLTITLRKGVKFHDGTDFNAEAVKFNLEIIRNSHQPYLKRVESIDVLDDYTVRLNFSRFDSALTDVLASIEGLMVSPTAVKTHGREWCRDHPVGTGPFEFVSWERDVSLKYKKFNGYWQKGKPYLDGIEFEFIADPMVAKASFLAGEAQAMRTTRVKDASELEKTGQYNLATCPLCIHMLIGDSKHPESPFGNIKVRRAVDHAIDRHAMVKAIGYGLLNATNQLVPVNHWCYNPAVVGYPYDPQKAKRLLSEAGYGNGFKTKLRVTSANQDAVAMVTAAQAYLGAVGIDAEVEVMGFPAIANYTEKGWDNALMIGQIGLQNDVGSSIERSISGTGRRAHSLIAPADYDAVLQQALAEPNIEAKKKNVQELMKLAIDKYAQVLPLYVDTSIIVHSKKLNNASFNQINTEWWAPADAWLSK